MEDTLALDDAARAELLPALLDAAQQNLDGAAAKSLRDLAKARTDIATAMFAMLAKLPVTKATGNFALDLGTDFRHDARTKTVLGIWAEKGNADVKRQARRGLQKI